MKNKPLMWAAVLILSAAVLTIVSLAVCTRNGSSTSTSVPPYSSTTADNSSTTSSNNSFEDSSSESSGSSDSNDFNSTTDNSSTTSSSDSFDNNSSESSSSSNSYDSDSTTDNSSSQESVYLPEIEANTWYESNKYTPLKIYNCAPRTVMPLSGTQSVSVEYRPICASCHYMDLTGIEKMNMVSPTNPESYNYYCRFCGATSVVQLEVVY